MHVYVRHFLQKMRTEDVVNFIQTEEQDLMLSRLTLKLLEVQVKRTVCPGSHMHTQYLFKDHLTNRRLSPRAPVSPDLTPAPLYPHHPHPDAIAPPALSTQLHCFKGCTTVAL